MLPITPSRRQLLGTVAGVVGAGAAADSVGLGRIDGWDPAPDTWPLVRRDLASTASAPEASVPAAPTVDWRASVGPRVASDPGSALVVGPDRVYAGTRTVGAFDRSDGTVVWREGRPATALALHDGRLFAAGPVTGDVDTTGTPTRRTTGAAETTEEGTVNGAGETPTEGAAGTPRASVTVAREDEGTTPDDDDGAVDEPRGTLRALTGSDGSIEWRRSLPGHPRESTVASGAVFVTLQSGGTAGHEAGRGLRRWHTAGAHGGVLLLVYEGALFVRRTTSLTRYGPRDLLDVPLRNDPPIDWEASVSPDPFAFGGAAAGAGGRVVTGGSYLDSAGASDTTVLKAVDAADGSVEWAGVEATDDDSIVSAGPLAVERDRDRVYARVYRQFVDAPESGEYRNRIVAFALDDGSRSWERTVPAHVRAVVHAGDVVLVGTERSGNSPPDAPPGTVRAFDTDGGTERWRVGLDAPVGRLAPVDGTVFVLTETGNVAALR